MSDAPFSPTLQRALLRLGAALNADELWKCALAILRAALPQYHVFMGFPMIGDRAPFPRTTLPIRGEPAQYWRRLAQVQVLTPQLAQQSGIKAARLSDGVPAGVLLKSPFYREFMNPEGWRFAAALVFWRRKEWLGHIAVNRTSAQGDFSDAEMALLERLHPHFQVTLDRLGRLERERAARRTLQRTLAHWPTPIVALDGRLRVRFASHSAHDACGLWRHGPRWGRVFKRGRTLHLPGDLIQACRELQESWRATAVVNWRSSSVRVVHPTRADFTATLRIQAGTEQVGQEPGVCVEFDVPETGARAAQTDPMGAVLCRLTLAERDVALLAAEGARNRDIAARLHRSVHTVRAQLRSVFKKLGVTSRARLIARCQRGG